MRVTNFSDADKLVPYSHKHPEVGDIFIPELSMYELEDYMGTVSAHCIKLAERKFEESKEVEELVPVSTDTNYSAETIAVWRGREKPKNLYEEKVMGKAALIFTQISLTMFLCDKDGECICPFDEPFGTEKKNRLKFFTKVISDEEFLTQYNKILLGTKDEAVVPNVVKDVKGKKK